MSSNSGVNEPFESLSLPRKDLPQQMVSRYRVYKDPENYDIIEAISALDALKASGKEEVYKVERDTLKLYNVLDRQTIINSMDPTPAGDAPAVAAAPAAPVLPTNETPLSSDQVDKLLNG